MLTQVSNPLGRLWEVDAAASGGLTTRFLYDGDALVAEYDDIGNLMHRYVHGVGTDVPAIWYEGAGVNDATRLQLFANWQGSITTIMKGDESGEMVAINGYDAYGIANETNIGRFQYTGQITIPELGLYHYKARVYSPTLGRFLQTDPIGYEDQVNLYAYVGNDPVNAVDPSGLCETRPGSRICDSSSETKLLRTVRIDAYDDEGNLNKTGIRQTASQLNSEITELTEKSEFSREYAVVGTLDTEANQITFGILEGPKSGILSPNTVNPRSYLGSLGTGHRLFYAAHTHNGLGVPAGGGPAATLRALYEGRGPNAQGPSGGDRAAATAFRKVRPRARFGVYYQILNDPTPRRWHYERF